MKALIIGLELEWRRGTGEKKQFGSPRGRAGESNASKVETWEATTWFARFARSKSIFWVGLYPSSSVPPHSTRLASPYTSTAGRSKRH